MEVQILTDEGPSTNMANYLEKCEDRALIPLEVVRKSIQCELCLLVGPTGLVELVCGSGHTTCAVCHAHKKRCSHCRNTEWSLSRTISNLKEIIPKQLTSCPFGCPSMIRTGTLRYLLHVSVFCDIRTVRCSGDNCHVYKPAKEIMDHQLTCSKLKVNHH